MFQTNLSSVVLLFPLLFTGCMFVPGTPFNGAKGAVPPLPSVNPTAPVMAPPGFLFELTCVPLALQPNDLNLPPSELREGKAEARQIVLPILSPLLSAAWSGDPLKEAMEKGNIRTLHHADIQHFNVLGIYSTQTVIAYGTE